MSDRAVKRGKGQTSSKKPSLRERASLALTDTAEQIATTLDKKGLGRNNRKIKEDLGGKSLKGALKRRDYNT